MGSFANSLHVRCTEAARVANAIREILAGEHWEPAAGTLDKEACTAPGANVRELHVSAPAGGWVSVLDSDLTSLEGLTRSLAERLRTHALLCFVDDSDSWSYQLAGPRGDVSVFDSAEQQRDEAGDDDAGGGLVQATAAIAQIQALLKDGSIQQRMQQIQAQMLAAAPPEIRAAEERIRNRQGTPADMQQYQAWVMREMPKHTADLRALLSGALPQAAAPKAAAQQGAPPRPAAAPELLDELRPIVAAGISDEQVQAVLGKQAVFAEEVLAEFLPLVGIGSFYANLSYDYLEEASPAELAAEGIRFTQRLGFRRRK